MICTLCDTAVRDGEDHMQSVHPDICDDLLHEYINDSVRDAVNQYIEEDEKEEDV